MKHLAGEEVNADADETLAKAATMRRPQAQARTDFVMLMFVLLLLLKSACMCMPASCSSDF